MQIRFGTLRSSKIPARRELEDFFRQLQKLCESRSIDRLNKNTYCVNIEKNI